MKKWHIEEDNLEVFYYLSTSEIWPNKSRWVVFGVSGLTERMDY
jgi:hypothetical protein